MRTGPSAIAKATGVSQSDRLLGHIALHAQHCAFEETQIVLKIAMAICLDWFTKLAFPVSSIIVPTLVSCEVSFHHLALPFSSCRSLKSTRTLTRATNASAHIVDCQIVRSAARRLLELVDLAKWPERSCLISSCALAVHVNFFLSRT